MCQSVGAAGFAASTTTGVAAVGTGIGGLVGGLWPGDKKSNNEASNNSNDNDDKPKGDNSVINKEAESAKGENGREEKNEVDEDIEHVEDDSVAAQTLMADTETIYLPKSIQKHNDKSKKSRSIEFKHDHNNPYYGIQKMLYPEEEYEEIIMSTGTQTEILPINENKEEKLSVHLDVRTPIGWGISAGLDSSRACMKQTMHTGPVLEKT